MGRCVVRWMDGRMMAVRVDGSMAGWLNGWLMDMAVDVSMAG